MSRQPNFFRHSFALSLAGTLASAAFFSPARADDIFTVVNPATGKAESVWAGVQQGSPLEILFSTHTDSGWSAPERITIDSVEDRNPWLAFTPAGDRRVFWWKEGSPDRVWYSAKAASGGTWSAPAPVSTGTDDARAPHAIVFTGTVFLVWEAVPGAGNRRIVVQKQESPDPWPVVLTWTASHAAPLDPQIRTQGTHLWVEWVDSATVLRWTEYVGGVWTPPVSEPYWGAADLEAARLRLRAVVTGK